MPTADGSFLYLPTVLDLGSRRLAGWSIADHMRTDRWSTRWTRRPAPRAGAWMAWSSTATTAPSTAARTSSGPATGSGSPGPAARSGTSADNAAAGPFNATLKHETLRGAHHWPDTRTARQAVFRWITRYNTRRRHSALGHLSPINYEEPTGSLTAAA
ncbi:transposase [Actinomadura decatromicini]|uniref:Transposase n=1 Tax=Actinomadura decatromicini TaxID=2604572 RepID=A0A5D3FRV9_9ACTN|nr:transposase [Actinomadura decatromicini]